MKGLTWYDECYLCNICEGCEKVADGEAECQIELERTYKEESEC